MLNVKELFESLSDKEKEELRKLLLSHTDVEKKGSKKDAVDNEFANIASINPLQKKIKALQKMDEVDSQSSEVKDSDLTVSEKQEFLIKFGYDPTNVKYMNTDILSQAYDGALKVKEAEAGGETITAIGVGMPTEG